MSENCADPSLNLPVQESMGKTTAVLNPLSPSGTYMVHKKPIIFSTPGLQGLSCIP